MFKALFKLGLIFSIAFLVLLFASLYDIRLNEVGHHFRESAKGFVTSAPMMAVRKSRPAVAAKAWIDAKLDRMPWARKLPGQIRKEIPEIDRAWVEDRKHEVEERIRGHRVKKADEPKGAYMETASRLRAERRLDDQKAKPVVAEEISERERQALEDLIPTR